MAGDELSAAQALSGTARTRVAILAAVTAAATASLAGVAFAALPSPIAATAVILAVWVGIDSLFSP